MSTAHIVGMIFAGLSGACDLLAAFKMEALNDVELMPLGILFFVVAVSVWSMCHHHPV